MLDIVIPHYKEPWFLCRKLFWMLDLQRIVNWNEIRVTVVNDGGHRLPEDELRRLSFPVEQIDIPKAGVSAARNRGMDHGTEPWILFCDCDDCFANIYALDEILTALRGAEADVVWAPCLTELGRIVVPVGAEQNFYFVHGKVFRRAFLLEHGIRFDEGMIYGEDTKFNTDVLESADRIMQTRSQAPAYVWIRRGGSVTASPRKKEGEHVTAEDA